MRLSRVTARAFGPFHGDQLDPAPGLTVVWGLNEAGKSTWHSAVGLTVTGFRRARGRPTKEEQVVIDQRRPWTGSRWRVEGLVHLDDGDELIVTWDLNERVATVHDALGRERSNEWISDGACDLSRIVGLDRSSFTATACVRQSDLQGVRENPALLQDLLQKAAASAAADGTASAAIAAINSYHQEHVGLNRSNSTKPLAAATRRLEQARHALEDANHAHQDRLALLEGLAGRRQQLAELTHRVEALRTAERLASARADDQKRTAAADEIESLKDQFKTLIAVADHHRNVLEVVTAAHRLAEARGRLDKANAHNTHLQTLQEDLAAKDAHLQDCESEEHALLTARRFLELASRRDDLRREVRQGEVASAAIEAAVEREKDIELRIAQLELEVADRAARRSAERFRRASELQERHPTSPPTLVEDDQLAQRAHTVLDRWHNRPAVPTLAGPTASEIDAELQALPDHPSGDLVPADEVLAGEREWRIAVDLQQRHEANRPAGGEHPVGDFTPDDLRRWADMLSSSDEDPVVVQAELEQVSTASAGPLAPLIPAALGVAALGLILGLFVHPALLALSAAGIGVAVIGASQRGSVDATVTAALEARLARAHSAAQQRSSIHTELTRHGLTPDPVQLRAAASAVESAQQSRLTTQKWAEDQEAYRLRTETAAAELLRELGTRGVSATDPETALAAYRAQCADRADQAALAGTRAALVATLDHRRQLEAQAQNAHATAQRLEAEIDALATDLGLQTRGSATEIVSAIQDWISTRSERRVHVQQAAEEWAELQHLLGGRTLAELQATANGAAQTRSVCAARVPQAVERFDLRDVPDHELEELERSLRAEHVEATKESARQAAPKLSDLRTQLDHVEDQCRTAQQELQQTVGERAGLFESVSVAEVDERLETCRRERMELRKARDETSGSIRQLETGTPEAQRFEHDFAQAKQELDVVVASHRDVIAEVGLDASVSSLEQARSEREEAVAAANDRVKEHEGTLKAKEQAFSGMPSRSEEVHRLAQELSAMNPRAVLGFDVDSVPNALAVSSLRRATEHDRSEVAEIIAGMEGRLEEREVNAVDPAAAAEAYESAHQELQRVQALGEVLETTRALLKEAQDEVHRDIAPRLNGATNRWLPTMFGGRYSEVRIDPASLDVRVFSEGDPRRADLLSQGTAEQFYLLLRIALVETLTAASGESCPLILDDITVNFDSERKVAALGLLKELASERQVILFTQEDEVRSWAEANLGESDKLVLLPGRVPVGSTNPDRV